MTQQAFGYLLSQSKYIERQVYRKKYPSIQYPTLVPVNRTPNAWARGITHFSQDMVGRPQPLAGRANDFPLADIERAKHDVPIEMAGLGYDYSLEELQQAMMLNLPLTSEKAMAVRRGVEEYIDNIVNDGRSDLGWDSLKKPKGVRRIAAAEGETGDDAAAKRLWANKKAEEIITDINVILMGVYAGYSVATVNPNDTGSGTVEMADTLLVPPQIWTSVLTKVISGTSMTVLEFIKMNNVYTAKTGRQLLIREYRGLEKAGSTGATIASGAGANADTKASSASDGVGRIIAYRRDPDVLQLHMPMPLRFLRPWQAGPMRWIVPAIFRLGGLEIRLPGAMRVMDGIV